MSFKNQTGMANSVDPDKMVHNEPSYQDLHGLQMFMFKAAGLKELISDMRLSRFFLAVVDLTQQPGYLRLS